MHAVVYVCVPRSQARNSSEARKKVCDYLTRIAAEQAKKAGT